MYCLAGDILQAGMMMSGVPPLGACSHLSSAIKQLQRRKQGRALAAITCWTEKHTKTFWQTRPVITFYNQN